MSTTITLSLLLSLLLSPSFSFVTILNRAIRQPDVGDIVKVPQFVPFFNPSFTLSSTSDDVTADVSENAEVTAPKRRGRPPKSSTAAPPMPAPPPAPLSPAEALEFVEKQWLETHTFDEEEEMDT